MSTPKSISSLTEIAAPAETDVVPVVQGGTTYKAQIKNIASGIPVATTAAKGLMSAADKTNLDQAVADITTLQNEPYTATIASAATITIPSGVTVIILTGTTNVGAVLGDEAYKTYTIYYPTGAGLTFLGSPMSAGDVFVCVSTP